MNQSGAEHTGASQRKKKRKRKNKIQKLILCIIFFCLGTAFGIFIGRKGGSIVHKNNMNLSTTQRLDKLTSANIPEWIDVQLIPVDGTSRDGTMLGGFNDIVIHYVGNPGTSAQNNHDYYCNPESEVSSHFVVGLEGEIIQCIPLGEMSAASNWRNRDTISIEVCHPDDSGKFTQATYDSLVKLTAWLQSAGGLEDGHIIRHYDVTGKACPIYYVEHEDAWEDFLEDVRNYK